METKRAEGDERASEATSRSLLLSLTLYLPPLLSPVTVLVCLSKSLKVSQGLCLSLSVSVYSFPPRMSEMQSKESERVRQCVYVMYVR